jgi:hypothetical protein
MDHTEGEPLTEVESITSVCLSRDNKKLLVNLSVSEIHMWDLEERKIEKKYFGQKQGRFVIRSCIGGLNENFVLSGSEGRCAPCIFKPPTPHLFFTLAHE